VKILAPRLNTKQTTVVEMGKGSTVIGAGMWQGHRCLYIIDTESSDKERRTFTEVGIGQVFDEGSYAVVGHYEFVDNKKFLLERKDPPPKMNPPAAKKPKVKESSDGPSAGA